MLALMLERLRPTQSGPIVIATSDRELDTPIARLAAELGVACVRGSESDVLERFALAARRYPSEHVVRLTADCPLSDPALVDEVVATHVATNADYTSNSLLRTFPDGLDVEVMRAEVLADASAKAHDPAEREHVTPFIYRNPARFRLAAHLGPVDLEDERWTVDTADDLAFVGDLASSVGDTLLRLSWRELADIVGVGPGAGADDVVLHVRRPGADGPHLGPIADPGHRTWDLIARRVTVGQISVRVDEGVGTVACAVPDELMPAAQHSLQRRLAADLQVHTRRETASVRDN